MQDDAQAVAWFQRAAAQADAPAQCNLVKWLVNGADVVQGIALCKKAAERGYAQAQLGLGLCYNSGRGVAKDEAEAVKRLRLAAEQGEPDAQCNLGLCARNGKGLPTDDVEAVKWYRLAAEQGRAGAQCSLGLCYSSGKGVAKDLAEAVKWLRLAAGQAHADAQYRLSVSATAAATALRATWWRRSRGSVRGTTCRRTAGFCDAEQGHTDAQYAVATVIAAERGVPPGVARAVHWYRRAAERGQKHAAFRLGCAYESSDGVTRDLKLAVLYYALSAAQGLEAARTALIVLDVLP